MSTRRSQRSAATKANEAIADTVTESASRSRRTTLDAAATATVSRGPQSSVSKSPESMRLTVKTSSTKLRQATRVVQNGPVIINSREQLDGGEILHGKRARNVRKSYVLESDSDEDEDEEMADIGDEDAEGDEEEDDEEEEEEEEDDDDGLGDEDADGDVDMDVPPPPPVIKISRAQSGRQTIVAKPPPKTDTVTIQQQEMDLGSDDEELSELDSDLGEEVEEVEEEQYGRSPFERPTMKGDLIRSPVDYENDDLDSDSDDLEASGSRNSSPDLKNLTKRQRARLEDGGSDYLLALPDEVQVKKHLTAEEHAMRRAEMARRRKNLSEKRNEEEKMETINKLLKKQAPKTNARRSQFSGAADGTPDSEVPPNPLFVRWISNKDGNRVAVPQEWMEGPAGDVFRGAVKRADVGGKLIAEVS